MGSLAKGELLYFVLDVITEVAKPAEKEVRLGKLMSHDWVFNHNMPVSN